MTVKEEMTNDNLRNSKKIIDAMDEHLRTELLVKDGKLQEKKLWENNFIKQQIDRRNRGEKFTIQDHREEIFTIQDHIRGMVYAMLSNQREWSAFESQMNMKEGEEKGRLTEIDNIFSQYNVDVLSKMKDEGKSLVKEITREDRHWGNRRITYQMKALINKNIPKLICIDNDNKNCGGIDNLYNELNGGNKTFSTLIKELSTYGKKYKMAELGKALTAEYLRNVGYDLAKPDTHILKVLGKGRLGFLSEKPESPKAAFEAISVIQEMADQINIQTGDEKKERQAAEVDFILWSYCAEGYGEICTATNPRCDECKVKGYCNKK